MSERGCLLAFDVYPVEEFVTPITITVIGDTHLRTILHSLPAPVMGSLESCDLILHTGDAVHVEVLEWLERFAPVRAVFGNNDYPELLSSLPEMRRFRFGRFSAGMIHGHNLPGRAARQAAELTLGGKVDIAIYGHSHQPLNQLQDGWLLFNPGSPTDRRRQPRFSFGRLTIDGDIRSEIISF